jgi:hypothetical protein
LYRRIKWLIANLGKQGLNMALILVFARKSRESFIVILSGISQNVAIAKK